MKTKMKTIIAICLLVIAGGVQAADDLDPKCINKYTDSLPKPSKLTGRNLQITASEFEQQVLSQPPYPLPSGCPSSNGKTRVWGYSGSYPGPSIEAMRGNPTTVTWVNNLSNPLLYPNVLTVDQSLHWAGSMGGLGSSNPYRGEVPLSTHLHGAMVSSIVDGHPDDWFTSSLLPKGKKFTYINDQEGATLWYHDHAMGVTRLNVYAGLAGFYLLRDKFEETLHLPGNSHDNPQYEREIVIQDRSFDKNGQLVFPHDGDTHPYWLPEFFGDVIVVNGKTWPHLEVEPRRYRFHLLNGSNARFYTLSMENGLPFWQIGTDAGFLDAPVKVSKLTLAPGERADVVVDFSKVAAGSWFLLKNEATAPNPNGDDVDPNTTGQIMQFRVVANVTTKDHTFDPEKRPTLRAENSIVRLKKIAFDQNGTPKVKVRRLTLNEIESSNMNPLVMLLDGKKFDDAVSELPTEGSTEIWEIINLTVDAHPMHLHLVPFQLLNRQKFSLGEYLKAQRSNPSVTPNIMTYLEPGIPLMPPDENEKGWKDVIRANPGEVTRVLVRFAPPDTPANVLNAQFPFNPAQGLGYVWHCHIIDHEDNEMMRPYKVTNLPHHH